jgi:hypothetical protein
MPKFTILEFDNDYRRFTGSEVREFASVEAAEECAAAESWDGYTYTVEKRESLPWQTAKARSEIVCHPSGPNN